MPRRRLECEIVPLLLASDAPLTQMELSCLLGCAAESPNFHLRILMRRGEVLRTGRGDRGEPYRYEAAARARRQG